VAEVAHYLRIGEHGRVGVQVRLAELAQDEARRVEGHRAAPRGFGISLRKSVAARVRLCPKKRGGDTPLTAPNRETTRLSGQTRRVRAKKVGHALVMAPPLTSQSRRSG